MSQTPVQNFNRSDNAWQGHLDIASMIHLRSQSQPKPLIWYMCRKVLPKTTFLPKASWRCLQTPVHTAETNPDNQTNVCTPHLHLTRTFADRLKPHLHRKHMLVRAVVLQLRETGCTEAIMKGNRQHGGLFDESRQDGTGWWPSRPEWAVLSVGGDCGLRNGRLAGIVDQFRRKSSSVTNIHTFVMIYFSEKKEKKRWASCFINPFIILFTNLNLLMNQFINQNLVL